MWRSCLLTKSEFTKELSKRTNLHPDIIRCVFDNISLIITENIINGETVELPKIGRFSLTKKKSRYGYNVANRQHALLDECVYPTCKVSPSFKQRVKDFMEKAS